MEIWTAEMIEKSHRMLAELHKTAKFVFIGGWAVWLHARVLKSKDIAIYINFDDFYKLQAALAPLGITVTLNPHLKKYEAKFEDVDIDIYTPERCPLPIPASEVFKNRWFETIEGFKVLKPEPLLLLKLEAEKSRAGTLKGFKDRVDILSLLFAVDIDKRFFLNTAQKYAPDAMDRLIKIIKTGREEYGYFFPAADNLRELKKLKLKLLNKSAGS